MSISRVDKAPRGFVVGRLFDSSTKKSHTPARQIPVDIIGLCLRTRSSPADDSDTRPCPQLGHPLHVGNWTHRSNVKVRARCSWHAPPALDPWPLPLPPRRELWSNPVERRPGAEGFARYKSLAPARNGMWRAGADYDWSPFPQEIG